ncbi:VPS52 [Candida oxycetoniae]|uniref:VPS52 n=1 Tax=Candida oxycetoniae TaxID=497107 RepID=A0AAI9X0C9_9ASCO|nr:VPS52 [Candida oxycetoniae]KAI3407014.2 VPS52 [Candida oxycetoniae]
MAIAALQKILPTDADSNEQAETEICDTSVSSDVSLVELMAEFHSYNKSLAQYKRKLQPIGLVLESFSTDLKELSSSLVSLERQSNDLSKDSKFNKVVTQRLEQLINEKIIPPETIKEILKDDLKNDYLDKVNYVLEKMGSEDSQLITAKVVERVRDFVISQIRLLRSNRTSSSQQIQRRLLEASSLFQFLKMQQPNLTAQLQRAYFHTMRWYYKSKFAKYIYSLEKLQKRHLESPVFDSSNYLNTFEQRVKILNSKEQCMPSQLAETITASYTTEFIIRQLLMAIIDNASVEYLFVIDFFYQGEEKDHTWAPQMFRDVFEMSRECIHYITSGTCDIYGILLSIKTIHNYQSKLHDLHVPILDDYMNSLLLYLWPICTRIIDLNCESLKRHMARSPKTLAPLAITQQFGLFLSALLRMSITGEPLRSYILRLQNDYENGITKASSHFKGIDKEIFLYNNYFLVLNILKNEAENATEEIKHFQLLANAFKTR